MFPHELRLLLVGNILSHDALDNTLGGFGKDMRCSRSAVFCRSDSVVMVFSPSSGMSVCYGLVETGRRPSEWSATANPSMGLISISDATGIGFGQRLTQATASSMDGNSQTQ